MTPGTRYCSRCLTTFDGDPERCSNLSCRSRKPAAGWGRLLERGEVLDRTYVVIQRLAIGGAGVTYLAQELDDRAKAIGPRLAIKVLYAQRDQGAYLRRLSTEAQILLELDHPNIVRIMGFVQRAGRSPYLVTRFESGGSLLDHLRRVGAMDPIASARLGIQLCDALQTAHGVSVIHRDLKPENVLLAAIPEPGEHPLVRLTDFGIAKVTGGLGGSLTRVGAFVGTPQYAAPEQFEGRSPTPAADVFAMGAVLRFCVTLKPLLAELDLAHPDETAQRLRACLPGPIALDHPATAGFNTFLAATLRPEPEERVTVVEARALLVELAEGRTPHWTAPVAAPAPTRTPPPPPRPLPRQEDDTFQGILSQGPRPEEEKTLLSGAAPPAATGLTEDGSAPPEPEKRSRSWGCLALLVLLLGMGGVGAPVGFWWLLPSRVPSALQGLLPAPHNPEGADRDALVRSLVVLEAELEERCGAGGAVDLTLVIEASGRVRSVQPSVRDKTDAERAGCLAQELFEARFERSAWSPAILAIQL